jgi:uncharacterized membrane protein HdeD (DUF308 family)
MATDMMHGQLAGSWKWFVIRGLVALVFGTLAIAWPGLTLTVLILMWGGFALADGVFCLVAAFQLRDGGRPMPPLIVMGLVGIAAGIATLVWPGMAALVLLWFIAVWAVIVGVLQLVAAVRFRRTISNELWLGLSGVLSILFGVVLFARPGAGAMALVLVIGWFAVLFGILHLMLGFRLKSLIRSVPRPA